MEISIIQLKHSATSLLDYGLLPGTTYDTIPQQRTAKDKSRVVYVTNPRYVKNDRDKPPLVAITECEYEVVA